MCFNAASTAPPCVKQNLTNYKLSIAREVVLRDFQVQRCRALPYSARDVVVGSVARAEPTAKVTSLADRNAAQMRADTCRMRNGSLAGSQEEYSRQLTQHNEPLGVLHSRRIGLGISQCLPLGIFCLLDLVSCSVADEDGLPSPFDDDLNPASVCQERCQSV